MALRVATIAKLTLNVLNNRDAVPCSYLWSSGGEPAPALILLGWMVHCSCLCISQGFLRWMSRHLHTWSFFMSRRNSKQSNGVEPFGGLLKSTLDNYLQLSRLLSNFKSIDHEKNISSCIARVAALWGTFENCPVMMESWIRALLHFNLGHGRILLVNSIFQWFYQLCGV
jgi:hypothetical protein